jgi:NAD(P)-dependent dehydrogenase (short-subunit alcohol dehydrogenase family)
MSEKGLLETQSKIAAVGRKSSILVGNVCKKEELDAAVAKAEAELGAITCAVNCAGIVDAAPAEDMSLAQWRRILDVDLDGVFLTCQALGKVMLPRKKGSIVNIASISASAAIKGLYQAHYNSAKAVGWARL